MLLIPILPIRVCRELSYLQKMMFVCHVRLTGWLDASVADYDIYVTVLPMLYSNLVDIILKVGFDVLFLCFQPHEELNILNMK